jgi:hypothetical protein
MWTEKEEDMTKLIVAFENVANAPKTEEHLTESAFIVHSGTPFITGGLVFHKQPEDETIRYDKTPAYNKNGRK